MAVPSFCLLNNKSITNKMGETTMASTSETGHAKNVANFSTLISFCTAYGTKYNPSKFCTLQICSGSFL